MFDIDFNPYTKHGQWFQKFEFALFDVIRKHLSGIKGNNGNIKCPILTEY